MIGISVETIWLCIYPYINLWSFGYMAIYNLVTKSGIHKSEQQKVINFIKIQLFLFSTVFIIFIANHRE